MVDYIIAETLDRYEEAALALDVIKATRVPAVVTLAPQCDRKTFDGVEIVAACARLAPRGAEVVGLNCMRGPATMMPLVHELRGRVDTPVAALLVPSRTTTAEPTGARAFPTALDPFTATREECAAFAREAHSIGVEYGGLCCGACPHHRRAVAETLGREPEAHRYSPDMSRHAFSGNGRSDS